MLFDQNGIVVPSTRQEKYVNQKYVSLSQTHILDALKVGVHIQAADLLEDGVSPNIGLLGGICRRCRYENVQRHDMKRATTHRVMTRKSVIYSRALCAPMFYWCIYYS